MLQEQGKKNNEELVFLKNELSGVCFYSSSDNVLLLSDTVYRVWRNNESEFTERLKFWSVKIKCFGFNDEGKVLEFAWKLSRGTSVYRAGSGINGKIGKMGLS